MSVSNLPVFTLEPQTEDALNNAFKDAPCYRTNTPIFQDVVSWFIRTIADQEVSEMGLLYAWVEAVEVRLKGKPLLQTILLMSFDEVFQVLKVPKQSIEDAIKVIREMLVLSRSN